MGKLSSAVIESFDLEIFIIYIGARNIIEYCCYRDVVSCILYMCIIYTIASRVI